jgi:hypothetical protein
LSNDFTIWCGYNESVENGIFRQVTAGTANEEEAELRVKQKGRGMWVES